MAYQFKLEALRRYRQFQEELQQKELSDAIKIHDQIVNEMQMKVGQRTKTEQELKTHQCTNATAPLISLYENYLKKMDADIDLQRQKVVAVKEMCDEKRNQLLDAMKKRKALERIKEKDFEKYLTTLERKEAAFVNEIAINRFAINQK